MTQFNNTCIPLFGVVRSFFYRDHIEMTEEPVVMTDLTLSISSCEEKSMFSCQSLSLSALNITFAHT